MQAGGLGGGSPPAIAPQAKNFFKMGSDKALSINVLKLIYNVGVVFFRRLVCCPIAVECPSPCPRMCACVAGCTSVSRSCVCPCHLGYARACPGAVCVHVVPGMCARVPELCVCPCRPGHVRACPGAVCVRVPELCTAMRAGGLVHFRQCTAMRAGGLVHFCGESGPGPQPSAAVHFCGNSGPGPEPLRDMLRLVCGGLVGRWVSGRKTKNRTFQGCGKNIQGKNGKLKICAPNV